jgi:hypothetical protein
LIQLDAGALELRVRPFTPSNGLLTLPKFHIHRKLEFSGFGYESAVKILVEPNDE